MIPCKHKQVAILWMQNKEWVIPGNVSLECRAKIDPNSKVIPDFKTKIGPPRLPKLLTKFDSADHFWQPEMVP